MPQTPKGRRWHYVVIGQDGRRCGHVHPTHMDAQRCFVATGGKTTKAVWSEPWEEEKSRKQEVAKA